MGAWIIVDLLALFLIGVGLGFGGVALIGRRSQSKSGIAGPAFLGIIINFWLLFIFVTNFVAAKARAHRDESAVAKFASVAPAGNGNARQTYEGQGLFFNFDGSYALKENKQTGQILLQQEDSQWEFRASGLRQARRGSNPCRRLYSM